MRDAPTTRIISGSLKGRGIQLPVSSDLRPTKNRVRQAMFNMLESRLDWDGLVVADLCCGSGALGLEALSRGCTKVFLVDTDVRAVRENVKTLGLAGDARVVVVQADVRTWAPPETLDVVVADPPYGHAQVIDLYKAIQCICVAKAVRWCCIEVQKCGAFVHWEGFTWVRREYGVSAVEVGVRG